MTTGPASTPSTEAAALAAALHEFTREWANGPLAFDLGGNLTCSELDALADLLATLGAHAAAQQWTESHALFDEDGDTHYTP